MFSGKKKIEKSAKKQPLVQYVANADFIMTEVIDAVTTKKPYVPKPKFESESCVRWWVSAKDLHEYQDALSGDMLRVWNIESMDPSQMNPIKSQPIPYEDKIASWFARDDFVTSTQQDQASEPPLFGDESSVFKDDLTANLNMSVTSVRVKPEKKPRKRHTMGF